LLFDDYYTYACAHFHALFLQTHGRRIEKFDGQYRSQLKIDRKMLDEGHVIGQAFNKWILVKSGADIVLVDQVYLILKKNLLIHIYITRFLSKKAAIDTPVYSDAFFNLHPDTSITIYLYTYECL